MDIIFDWVPFYKELAWKLLPYKEDHIGLVAKVRRIYDITGISLPTLERNNQIVDMDPFTFFGLFNKSSMKEENRKKILSVVANLFDVSYPIPSSFSSIPVLNNQNATFYYFVGQRGEEDIDDLWCLFQRALSYASGDTTDANTNMLIYYFDRVIQRKGNGNGKITMGLYWIAPETFLNLDSRNQWYIYDSGKLPEELVKSLPPVEDKIPAEKYISIIYKLKDYLQSGGSTLKDFKELSAEAWRYSEEVNMQNKARKAIELKNSTGSAVADEDVKRTRYWMYAPGEYARMWDENVEKGIMAIGWDYLGDLSVYGSKSEMKQKMKELWDPSLSYKMAALATWQFANEIKPGDVVFAKRGLHTIIGRGIVESDYIFDDNRAEFKNVRKVKWIDKGEWHHQDQIVTKALTDVTPYTDYVADLNAMFEHDIDDIDAQDMDYPVYDAEQFLEDVYMDRESYVTLVDLVRTKKNVILQGAPGVGKTYAAKRLAYSMMGMKDPNRVTMIQFHQSYSYEDFIMGFRPSEKGFELKRGVFYNFCKEAEIDSDNEYFFIIDEINRGNLSKIFGELFMLVENDKRGIELQLLYADEKFSIPDNVYIIGMMNTADRSLAMLDYALRRRFAFFDMKPGFNAEGFRAYRAELNSGKFDKLIACVESLNNAIAADDSLGEGFCIGHSYFCNLKEASDRALSNIVEYEIIPLLKEYWFDEPVKIKDWSANLRSAIK